MINTVEGVAQRQAQVSEAVRAREALTAAQAASTALLWESNTDGYYNYRQPLAALRDAQVASGQATLAVAEELAAMRAEIGQVAEATRELTRTIAAGAPATLAMTDAAATVVEAVNDLEHTVTVQVAAARDAVCTEVADAARSNRRRWWNRRAS